MVGKIMGIYKITSPSGRIYIGQSVDIRTRWTSYKRKDCKKQVRLKNSFEKYGVENHIFEVIEECDFEQLNIRERHWQDFYDVLNGGLNCNLIGTDSLPKKCLKGQNSKSIKVIDVDTKIIYSSIGDAAEQLNICKTKLKNCLNGSQKNTTSLIYLHEYGKEKIIIPKPKKIREYTIVYDIVTLKEFKSIKIAAEAYKINLHTLKGWLHGMYKNKSNLRLKEPLKITKNASFISKKVIDESNGFIYTSIIEAAKELNINRSTLKNWLDGKGFNKSTLKYL